MPVRRTTDIMFPLKKDSKEKDKRYTSAQVCKEDGRRDMRTTLTADRK